jgi:hypothetical protein
MGKTPDNHWRIPAPEQPPPRPRDQVLQQITRALVANPDVGVDGRQRGGFDPYDSRLGAARRDVWGHKRRA